MSKGFLDLVQDAVGWIADGGALRAENRAMSMLCGHVIGSVDSLDSVGAGCAGRGSSIAFLDLPFDDEDRAALAEYLASGGPTFERVVRLRTPESDLVVRVAVASSDGGHWVVMRDETGRRRDAARAMRMDRLRLVVAMSEDLVHDINNLMGALIGFADLLVETETNPKEREFLTNIIAGTRERGTILKGLQRLLRDEGIHRQRVSLSSLVSDALGLFCKTALKAGIRLSSDVPEDLPDVRVVPEDVLQTVLSLLARAAEQDVHVLRVEVRRETVPGRSETEPTRTYGVIRILDDGDEADAVALDRILSGSEGSEDGFDSARVPESLLGVFLAVAAIRIYRGFFRFEGMRDGMRSLAIFLPAACAAHHGR